MRQKLLSSQRPGRKGKMENLNDFLLNYLQTKYNASETVIDHAKKVLEQLEKGSVCFKIENETVIEELKKSSAVGTKNEIRPLILDGINLYIQRYYIYQTGIINNIDKMVKDGRFHIITGGPGTGKTTSLAKILAEKLNENIEQNILLAAPTGKAAYRMNEALRFSLKYDEKKEHTHWVKNTDQKVLEILNKLESKTLHRLLGYIHLSVNFKHTSENPLNANIIVIDECSMVDLPMMSKLLDAVPDNCNLFLLGDKNQLASVEVGSVFADICEKYKRDGRIYKELTENHRAKDAPGIVKLSNQILKAKEDKSDINFDDEIICKNIEYRKEDKYDTLIKNFEGLFNARNKEETLNMLKKFQILCTTKTGINGTEQINKRIKELAKKVRFTPIIITENNYELKLFNGDVGVKDEKEAHFIIGEEIKSFSALTLPAHELAYAITIHKSQGSEYDCIAVVYPNDIKQDDSKTFLTGELLYTAITRAKKKCLIFGSKDIIVNSCKNTISRASGI